ncbi:hypothetical protein FW774_18175 [Pedobacter sp. BS3]|nr:hypothetical protein FW774_18175 [Pedobacter sp. BS3]
MTQDYSNKTSHILNASSNLLGFCFLVLTSLKFLKLSDQTLVDELTATALLIFMVSCLFAFLSIRGKSIRLHVVFENIAEYAFMAGLLLIFVITILITFKIIA